MQTNYFHAGGSGRLKYSLVDFDHDGRLDLLLGTCGYHAIPCEPSPPASYRHYAYILVLSCF